MRGSDWRPTAIRRLDMKPGGIGLAGISGDLLIFCGGSQIWTPADVFRCFKEFETRQQKKIWRKVESPAGKCTSTKQKLA